ERTFRERRALHRRLRAGQQGLCQGPHLQGAGLPCPPVDVQPGLVLLVARADERAPHPRPQDRLL
ncbi:MAG: hypothetical protein AVDCRST_MAG76-3737, partial [uncultured Acidimicrobiales bacterium]